MTRFLSSREMKRLVARVSKSKKQIKPRHLSGKEIIEKDGLGCWMKYIPLTQDQKAKMNLFVHTHLEAIRTGEAEDTSFSVAMSCLLEGYCFSKFFFDDANSDRYQREFKSSARLLDSAWLAFKKHKQTLESNISHVKESCEMTIAMRDELNREECNNVLKYIEENYEQVCVGIFDGVTPKSFDISTSTYVQ